MSQQDETPKMALQVELNSYRVELNNKQATDGSGKKCFTFNSNKHNKDAGLDNIRKALEHLKIGHNLVGEYLNEELDHLAK